MPLAGLVLNRVHRTGAPTLSAERSTGGRASSWRSRATTRWPRRVLRLHADRGARWRDARAAAARALHRRAPGRAAWSRSRRWPATCTTSTGCGPSARELGREVTASGLTLRPEALLRRRRAPCGCVLARGPVSSSRTPRRHVRAAAQQRPALPLGHAAPDAELHAVVQRVRQALGAHGAAHADGLGAVLRRALHEQRVRVGSPGRPPALPSQVQVMPWSRRCPEPDIRPQRLDYRWLDRTTGRMGDSLRRSRDARRYGSPRLKVRQRRTVTGPVGPSSTSPDGIPASARRASRTATGVALTAWPRPPRRRPASALLACCSCWSASLAGMLVAGVRCPLVGGVGLAARADADDFRACRRSWRSRRCPSAPHPRRRRLAAGDVLLREPHLGPAQRRPPGDAEGDHRGRGRPLLRAPRRRPEGHAARRWSRTARRAAAARAVDADPAVRQERPARGGADQGRGRRPRRREASAASYARQRYALALEQRFTKDADPRALPEHRLLRQRGLRRRDRRAALLRHAGQGPHAGAGRDARRASCRTPSATTRLRTRSAATARRNVVLARMATVPLHLRRRGRRPRGRRP